MRDLGPTSAARKPFWASSGAADGRGGGSKLPLAATFGSFGSSSSELLQPPLARTELKTELDLNATPTTLLTKPALSPDECNKGDEARKKHFGSSLFLCPTTIETEV
ncbi:hypothetical protein PGT21_008836 [Puccinia graminis f. sp. tritici]|uniref:Uncharacterized protein n=1 Tax=Puccinia graminis f. sp. tritici TaxID=56615 RepID=A0A5B0PEN0_PUCGR|nr:hypothetical protein PGT21_008836 [Puccinia graminis f. sp. tritici]KAA1099094.1 hypothetical protein PGTUg99_017605 [Puccinia graminis f. sp. tritici]